MGVVAFLGVVYRVSSWYNGVRKSGEWRRGRLKEDIKWVFFDVGSTLVDESRVYERRMRSVAKAAGVSYEQVYEMALAFYHQNKKGDLETMKQLQVEKPKWTFEDEVLYPDTVTCLDALKKRYRIGVIANQSLGLTQRLAEFGLMQYIDLVISSAEEGVAKPNPRIFEIALERSGCAPKQTVMIGDRVDNDIVPAKALGMRTIWIKQGFGKYWKLMGEAEQADAEVDCLTELLDFL